VDIIIAGQVRRIVSFIASSAKDGQPGKGEKDGPRLSSEGLAVSIVEVHICCAKRLSESMLISNDTLCTMALACWLVEQYLGN
jgi:hypothetical protein